MAGSVIQATGRTDFEDGLRIGNQSEVGNSLQRVRTIPENKGIIVLRGGVDQVPPGAQRNIKCSIHSLDLPHLRGSRGQIVATLGLVFDHFGLIYTFFDDIE